MTMYFNNNKSFSKSKHIDIKFLVVKDRFQSDQIFIKHIDTNSIIVDQLIKGLTPMVFHEHIARMGVILLDDMSV